MQQGGERDKRRGVARARVGGVNATRIASPAMIAAGPTKLPGSFAPPRHIGRCGCSRPAAVPPHGTPPSVAAWPLVVVRVLLRSGPVRLRRGLESISGAALPPKGQEGSCHPGKPRPAG